MEFYVLQQITLVVQVNTDIESHFFFKLTSGSHRKKLFVLADMKK